MLQKILWTIVAIVVVVWIISSPSAAGDSIHGWITDTIMFFRHMTAT